MCTILVVPKVLDNAATVYSYYQKELQLNLLAGLLLDLFLNSNSAFLKLSEFNCHRTTKPSRIMGSLQCSVQYKLHFLHSYNLEDYTLIYSSPFFISMLHQIIIAFRTSILERHLSKLVLLFICKAISVFLNSKVSTDIGKTNSFNRYLLRSYPSIWRV